MTDRVDILFVAALLAPFILSGCSSDAPPRLSPIPEPAAVIVKVPTLVPLPIDLTEPCAEPTMPPQGVKTDVDLWIVAQEWRRAAKCANGRLTEIRRLQPEGAAP